MTWDRWDIFILFIVCLFFFFSLCSFSDFTRLTPFIWKNRHDAWIICKHQSSVSHLEASLIINHQPSVVIHRLKYERSSLSSSLYLASFYQSWFHSFLHFSLSPLYSSFPFFPFFISFLFCPHYILFFSFHFLKYFFSLFLHACGRTSLNESRKKTPGVRKTLCELLKQREEKHWPWHYCVRRFSRQVLPGLHPQSLIISNRSTRSPLAWDQARAHIGTPATVE